MLGPLQSLLRQLQLEVLGIEPDSVDARQEGQDGPLEAETMVGLKRLGNLQYCVTKICQDAPLGRAGRNGSS